MNDSQGILDVIGSSTSQPYGLHIQIPAWIIVILLSLETIIGNAMVIVAYKMERNISKQTSNRYIVSLAISDLIIGVEGYPLFTVYVLNGDRWPLGRLACETWLFLDYTLCLVSILTVLLITVDRYLSVCHTASYIKWQTPNKAQITIILSWIIPTLIFGFMIYGWSLFSHDAKNNGMDGECAAPFLSNPYVNMAMYLVYYWTTLLAMLILYKGIHQAAKKLEKKARAKERGHIALIISQRLGTQVGVSLMLSSDEEAKVKKQAEHEDIPKDSGYQTVVINAAVSTSTLDKNNMQRIISENESFMHKSEMDNKAIDSEKTVNTGINMQEEPSSREFEFLDIPKQSKSNSSQEKSAATIMKIPRGEVKIEEVNNRPNSNRRFSKRSRNKLGYRERNRISSHSCDQATEIWSNPERNLVKRMKDAFARNLSKRRLSTSYKSKTPSLSSCSSSEDESSKFETRLSVPSVLVKQESPRSYGSRSSKLVEGLSRTRMMSRRLLSATAMMRERNLQPIFSPITFFQRARKQTRAERRAHKAFRTITFIVGLFAILWSPYYVMATIYGFCRGQCIPTVIYNLTYYMCYLNSSGNPFAYALANRQFRSAFLNMFRGNFHRRNK